MPLYRLTPREESKAHIDWRASTYYGTCLVSAASPDEARQFATLEFGIAVKRESPYQDTASNPWRQPARVDCKEIAHLAGPLPPYGLVSLPSA